MPDEASERSFQNGLRAMERRSHLEALAYFEAAVKLSRRQNVESAPIYLSYYGWSLARFSNRLTEARDFCEAAARREFYNPEVFLNLGRVYLRCGDRSRAFSAFVRGIRLNPRHPGLIQGLRRLGIRQRPVVRFFDRSHPLNRLLGRIRGSLFQEAAPARKAPSATGA